LTKCVIKYYDSVREAREIRPSLRRLRLSVIADLQFPPLFFLQTNISLGFMKKKIVLMLSFLFLWISPVTSSVQSLKIEDISRVMERLCHFHIESKNLSPELIRRALKIYVEQFDFEKAYLLESEIAPYVGLSQARAEEIYRRVSMRDYSDFIALNQVFEKAILRAQGYRQTIAKQLIGAQRDVESRSFVMPSQYAKSEKELMERQQNRMVRFYSFHKNYSTGAEYKEKVYFLFEKKVQRAEAHYLLMDSQGRSISVERMEHALALRILKAFAKSLDTHTAFFSPEEAHEMRMSLEKQFEGVGVILSEGVDGVMIADLIAGSPAQQSGRIQVNDFLVEIDGKSIANVAFEDVLDMMKKRDHSEIVLGFKRITNSSQSSFYRVALKKQPISVKEDRIQTSFERVEGGIIGKIALHSFYESSDGASSERDIKEAIRSFREQGELKGLVLDLRENSGGFLGQAVRVTGLFVSNGVVVISKYGKGDVHYLRNIVGKTFFNGPLVVLTSKMSASAAEIVAQAIQDYGVGLIVGDKRTFGKGSIQYQTITDPNADIFFKVTVGRYYTVSGKSTQITGVLADIVVPTPYAPYHIGEKYLEFPLQPDQVEAAYVDPLTDLDERTRILFQKRYMPYLQRVVPFWKKALPELRKKSVERLSRDPAFQAFLKRLEVIRARQSSTAVNSIDEPVQIHMEDLQMNESIHIIQDMIDIEARSRKESAHFSTELPTGSD
jgi:carboxyl-terminal processing protease